MKERQRISVVIPVYNVEPYLHRCLDSIINQTYRNLEIILIDDGSPDNCGIICDEYAAMDTRITVVHKENAGLCAARNDGIIRASGEWISFIDSDDWCELDYYEQFMTHMGDMDVDVYCANGAFFEYKPQPKIKTTFDGSSFSYFSHAEMEQLMVKVLMTGNRKRLTMGVSWEKVYRTSFLKKNNCFFDITCKAWEDLLFNFQVFDKAKKVAGFAYAGYHYRIVENSITKGFNPQKLEIGYDFLFKLHSYLNDRVISEAMEQALDVRAIEVIANSLNAYQFHPKYTEGSKIQAEQIREIRNRPYFQHAIRNNCNTGLDWHLVMLKYFLRLPCIWPLQICKKAKRYVKDKKWNRKNL